MTGAIGLVDGFGAGFFVALAIGVTLALRGRRKLRDRDHERTQGSDMPEPDAMTWAMMTDAGIDTDLVERDPTGNGYFLIKADRMICFGPATTETGDPAEGWDITAYVSEDNGWNETGQHYELTPADAARKVAEIIGPD